MMNPPIDAIKAAISEVIETAKDGLSKDNLDASAPKNNLVIVSDGFATALLLNDMWLAGVESFTYEADGTDITLTLKTPYLHRLSKGGRKEFYEAASKMLGYKLGEK